MNYSTHTHAQLANQRVYRRQ